MIIDRLIEYKFIKIKLLFKNSQMTTLHILLSVLVQKECLQILPIVVIQYLSLNFEIFYKIMVSMLLNFQVNSCVLIWLIVEKLYLIST